MEGVRDDGVLRPQCRRRRRQMTPVRDAEVGRYNRYKARSGDRCRAITGISKQRAMASLGGVDNHSCLSSDIILIVDLIKLAKTTAFKLRFVYGISYFKYEIIYFLLYYVLVPPSNNQTRIGALLIN